LEEEQEQQQPLSATFSDNARFEDLAADMENQEKNREVLQPRTESLVPAPQQAEDEGNSSQSLTEAGNVKTTKKNVQPGPTGPPGPSGRTRSVSGAAAAVGERAGPAKARKSSSQVQGEGDSPQGRGFRPDLDESNSCNRVGDRYEDEVGHTLAQPPQSSRCGRQLCKQHERSNM
jgi:hypothetical protein